MGQVTEGRSSPVSPLRLLRTKLFVPHAHPELVSRPRLLDRLDGCLRCRLILVSAAAGFGKTTLLSTWIAQRDVAAAWVSLDDHDDDPARFWAYAIAALQTVWPGVGAGAAEILQAPQPPAIEGVLTELLNDVAGQEGHAVLVLDDYHVIQETAIHQGVAFLVEHSPPQLLLILASRTDPPLPLPLLRARRQLLEIKAEDLRFTRAEADTFFNMVMGLALASEDVAALEMLTEGWAAGLQLAALSIQEVADVGALVASFSGSHRYVFDYLAQEVIDRQRPELRCFLMQTAVLNRLNGDLCDAVTGLEDGQRVLEQLEQANLFVVPLDRERRWYRYHHLFSDFLRSLLEQCETPEAVAALHLRACDWHAAHGDLPEAIQHALDAKGFDRAAALITAAVTDMFQRSELLTLLRWLRTLPEDLIAQSLFLSIAAAWANLATGDSDAVERHLQRIERTLGVSPDSASDNSDLPPEARRALAEICSLRGSLSFNRMDLDAVRRYSRLVGVYLADDPDQRIFNSRLSLESVAAFNLALAYEYSGESGEAMAAFEAAIELLLQDQNHHLIPMSESHLAQLQVKTGQLRAAGTTYDAACQSVGDWPSRSPLSGLAFVGMGRLLYEWNELDRAHELLRQGLELGKQWSHWEILFLGYASLIDVALAGGDDATALAILDEWQTEAKRIDMQLAMPVFYAHRALIMMRTGRLGEALEWASSFGIPGDGGIPYAMEDQALILARICIAGGDLDRADGLLARLRAGAEGGGRQGRLVQTGALESLLLDSQGDGPGALEALTQALTLAQPEGYVRTFVDLGEPMRRLLERVTSMPEYTARLLTADAAPQRGPVQDSLIEPLSDRELDVLALMAEGLTNQEIADRLFISVNTVKTHAKSLYGKLSVRNRAEATLRARELNLI